MRPLPRAVALLLLSATLGGCLSSFVGPAPTEPGPTTSASPPSPSTTAPGASAAGTSAPASGQATVTIRNFLFDPANFTVHRGAVVTVHNADTTTHTLTAQDRSFDTGPIAPGTTAAFTAPAQPGAYSYLCTYHHFMRGILTVT
ncbi:cupredoxin domain-containing protein [Kitasatospora sp. NPDC097643]|uniref:cupredoxin domain-containing protein n=1 Tax=Kitasatospora sp. NPDC097643 TaxID=3157230 RepID=UPI00331D8F40